MRTHHFTVELYNYEELSKEAKRKVNEWYLEADARGTQFEECVSEDLKEFFPHSDLILQYSLAGCQGDGANVYGKLALLDALNFLGADYTEKQQRTLSFYIEHTLHSVKLEYNSRYSYSLADYIYFSHDMISDLDYECGFRNIDEDLIRDFEKRVVDWFSNFNSSTAKFGYDFLYNVEDDEVAEFCESSNLWFTQDGILSHLSL